VKRKYSSDAENKYVYSIKITFVNSVCFLPNNYRRKNSSTII